MPPPVPAELSLMVLFVTVRCALVLKMPPPSPPAELPLMMLSVTVSVAEALLMPPPLLLPTRLAELLTMLLVTVRTPWFKMPPPPLPSASPLVMVNPAMVTFEAKVSNTRKVALPLTARLAAPGPLIVTLWVT